MARIRTKTSSLAAAKYHMNRAILEQLLDSRYTEEDREKALQYFDGCAFCGEAKSRATRNDHLIAVKNRGDFVPKNVVPACQRCDDSKGKDDFRHWMRNATSPSSLRGRGWTDADIEKRIKLIQAWQRGYKPRSEKALFGKHLAQHRAILRAADLLRQRADDLVEAVRRDRDR